MVGNDEIEKYIALVRAEIDLSSEIEEQEVLKLIAEIIFRETIDKPLALKDKDILVKSIFDSIRKLDVIQELIENEDVAEITSSYLYSLSNSSY